jgi:hypothetical protein
MVTEVHLSGEAYEKVRLPQPSLIMEIEGSTRIIKPERTKYVHKTVLLESPETVA